MFSETSRYQKKVDAKNYLIFKNVVENTRLKKIIPNIYRQTNFVFRDRAARRDLNLYRKSMEHVIVMYTLEAANFGARRDRGILFLCSKWTRAKANENQRASFGRELRNREFWVDFDWVGCFDWSLGKSEVYKLLWKWLFWIPDTLGNMIFNIFLKLKVKLLLSGELKLKVFSRFFTTIFRPNKAKIRLYFEIYIFQTFKSSKHVYFLSGSLIKQKNSDFHFHIPFLRDTPPPSIFPFSLTRTKMRNFILMQGTPRKNGSNQNLTLNLNE